MKCSITSSSPIHANNRFSIPALLLNLWSTKHPHSIASPPPPAPELQSEVIHLPRPATGNHDTRDDVHQPDDQRPEAAPLLHDAQRDGLDVEFHKDTGHALVGHGVRLRCHSVLVCLDCVLAEQAAGGGGVGGVELA